jgi:hypothetical protein
VIETTRVRTLIIDHHLLRDPNWKEEMVEVFERGRKAGKKVVTVAGFLGKRTRSSRRIGGSSLRGTPTCLGGDQAEQNFRCKVDETS